MKRHLLALALCLAPLPAFAAPTALTDAPALAMHGTPKYAPDFTHFDYTNPAAPKGSTVKLSAFGGFDNLNPFILKGEAADGLGLTFDTLMVQSADEAFSAYGLVASSVDLPADRTWIAFNLRPEAKFSDGTAVTAADVVWTFNTLREKGAPQYRTYYMDVTKVEAESPTRVKFTFKDGANRELPLILGQLPVLPEHFFKDKDFAATTLIPVVGSGPYKVKDVQPGRSISYELRADYWGKDLAVNKGRYNFGVLVYDYYRDMDVMFEAFKAGAFDFRLENMARNWASGYDVPAVKNGQLVKDLIGHEDPQGMQGFLYNTRREMFQDVRVRQALTYALDFEWMNSNFFYGQYTRANSYWASSELASSGLPSPAELALLEPLKSGLPEAVFTTPYALPVTKGDGNVRESLKQAVDLLKQAGYELQKGVMTHVATGKPLTFEILNVQQGLERIALSFIRNLERIGVKASLRTIDTAQYINRVQDFDFDMIVHTVPASISPGNELLDQWSSARADIKGAGNLAGAKSPAIDALIEKVLAAEGRDELITATRALDRVLLNGWYVVPNWYIADYRVAYWNRFGKPETRQKYGLGFLDTWWVDAPKDAALADKLKRKD